MSDAYSTQGITPQEKPKDDLAGQWRQWIDDPGNKAALMQFGIALSQPVGLGQNTMGHIGGALGQAGAASDRISEEERAAAEQKRKEAETDSKGVAREAAATNAETRANAAAQRAQFAGAEVDSKIALRRSQALAAESRAGHYDSQVKMLEMRLATYPDDAQARIDLAKARAESANAQTELSLARAGITQQDADTRSRNADTRATDVGSKVDTRSGQLSVNQQRADTQRDLGGQRTEIARDRVSAAREGQGLTAAVRSRRDYDKYVADTNKANADAKLLDPRSTPQSILPMEEWKARGAGSFPSPLVPDRAPREGQTATNPETKERMIYRSGKWMPL